MNKSRTKNKNISDKLIKIVSILEKEYPNPTTDLISQSPFQLLVATMLSAQCTDKRVNLVTPSLFEKYPTALELSNAEQEDVEKIIYSTGFYRNKSKNIIACAKDIVEKHGGEVPDDINNLTLLPGVGRKTANCVLGNYFQPAGIVVDTHVIRICNLVGVVNSKNPEQIEKQLMALLPKEYWVNFTHYLIKLGRDICIARRPQCMKCKISEYCDYALSHY